MKRYKSLYIETYELFSEKDNRKAIEKVFQFPDGIVQTLHEMDKKHSITLANILFNSIKLTARKPQQKAVIKKIEQKKILNNNEMFDYEEVLQNIFNERNKRVLRYIRDWVKGRNERPNPDEDVVNLTELDIDKANRLSQDWHEYIAKGGGGAVTTGSIAIQYKDGFYWVNLETNVCEEEGKQAGHCGRGEFGADSNLYSLRTPQHKIALTADVNKKTRDCRQMRGNANTKPKPEYHKYIIDFLTNKKINIKAISFSNAWKAGANFHLKDLSEKDYQKLLKVHPDWEMPEYGDIQSRLDESDMPTKLYNAVEEFMIKEGYSVEDIENVSGHFIEFSNGTEWRFIDEATAEEECYDYLEDLLYILYEDVEYESWLDEYALERDLLSDLSAEYDYGYEEPEAFLNEEPEDDGEWSIRQKERAGELAENHAKDMIKNDPLQYIKDRYDSLENWASNITDYVDERAWMEHTFDMDGFSLISHYDGSYYIYDRDIVVYRID